MAGHLYLEALKNRKHWRSSNFNRNVLKRAYLAAGWRDADGAGTWTWHSLRQVFCTTALFTWKLDPADVSRLAGHATSGSPSTCTSALPAAFSSVHARQRRAPPTTCPACRRPLAWTVTRSGPPQGPEVAHFLVSMENKVWNNVVYACSNQRLFCSEGCVQAWLAAPARHGAT